MQAGGLVGLDISVDRGEYEEVDGVKVRMTVATVKIYPHVIKVQVRRDEPYTVLLEKIRVAIVELHSARGTQF